MKIRWQRQAAADLAEIHAYLTENSPSLAHPTVIEIHRAIHSLGDMPLRGRPGVTKGTRELVLSRIPYLIVYRVQHNVVEVLYIRHTARDR